MAKYPQMVAPSNLVGTGALDDTRRTPCSVPSVVITSEKLGERALASIGH